ncbi:hypothetical protein BDW72DRAFT_205925 [Aspergillus terricola var. indicus]
MTTSKRRFLPREGLYIDPIIMGLRKLILHPLFALSCLLALVQTTAATSVLLWLNDWLSTKSRNNWVSDKSWDWEKELVVVTGGSGCIGAGVAQRLAAMGSRVIVLEITLLGFESDKNKRISYYKCDLSDEKDAKIGDTTLTFAVNNAGLSRGRKVVEGPYSDNSITLKTNPLAPQKHGHIFNVASVSAYIPPPGPADYAASKAGLIAFHEVRTSLAVLNFTETPLFQGETNQSQSLMPLLYVDTVVDTIFLPATFGYLAGLDLVRVGTRYLKVDFKGRQIMIHRLGDLFR